MYNETVMKRNRVLISEYESEARLREPDSFSLPSLRLFQKRNEFLLNGMDGLTIAMLEDGDTIVTRKPLPEEYLRYWTANIRSISNFSPHTDSETETLSVYQLLERDSEAPAILKQSQIINYAAVPEYFELCRTIGITPEIPSLSLIRQLNSKAYSNELRIRLDLPAKGVHLQSPEEYDAYVYHLLEEWGTVLIKDSMGVSGKGIMEIDSSGIAERIGNHFHRQMEEGKTHFDFILEPKLNRKTDFSCQFHITGQGEVVIDGYQKNASKGYAYLGSGSLSQDEQNLIHASGYVETIQTIAADMASLGFYGYACTDSMITMEDRVIPLLEINPRMSMARFNLNLETMLGRNCRLCNYEGIRGDSPDIDTILNELDEADLLYTKDRGKGVIPLAPSIWCVPEATQKHVRVYYVIVFDTESEYEKISDSWLAYCAGRICSGTGAKKTA